ncbi:FDXHR family putative zinc-binding protein [Paraburkholderia phymatum]|uniref:FDXHR family putative zinc-binding protein n=1 Tax=Paraburkholderia phymatum TaxID=148447 RepID=UPI0000E78F4B
MPRIPKKLTGDRNQCRTCREFFNSSSAFDKHRTGPFGTKSAPAQRRCLSPDEMRAAGMLKNDAGFWIKSRMDDAEIQRRTESRKNAREAVTPNARSRPSVAGVSTIGRHRQRLLERVLLKKQAARNEVDHEPDFYERAACAALRVSDSGVSGCA